MRYFLLFVLLIGSTSAETERYYQERYCSGRLEVVLEDRTRIDCETAQYAIEYDFARNWAEAIGQSLHYARLTGKKAGIVLIIENLKDCRHVVKANDNISYYWLPIRLQTVGLSC